MSKDKSQKAATPKPEEAPKAAKAQLKQIAEKHSAKTSDATAEAVAKKITEKKDLKYNYPADCDTLAKRKKFRTQARREDTRLRKAVKAAEKGKGEQSAEEATKAYASFKKKTYAEQAN